jgi:hypothetical protein
MSDSILENIARVTGEYAPVETGQIEAFVRKINKKPRTLFFARLTQESRNYLLSAWSALKLDTPVPVPPDFIDKANSELDRSQAPEIAPADATIKADRQQRGNKARQKDAADKVANILTEFILANQGKTPGLVKLTKLAKCRETVARAALDKVSTPDTLRLENARLNQQVLQLQRELVKAKTQISNL